MSTSRLSNRLERLEKAIEIEHSPDHTRTSITRYSGEEARQRERAYILTMCRARLGECNPSQVIFLSKRIKMIRENYPGFPLRMTKADAEMLIKKFGG
ncbi:hypothetical protein [Desulfobacter curvatus]|uniref:hypothetical protein n=1 Tax=Desulfobacter curvatus TaxID=2290 RepID=UPI00037C87D3|nr:hypothetical protein [Desulfobacter curvatus]